MHHESVYQRLIARGFSHAQLEAASDSVDEMGPRSIGLRLRGHTVSIGYATDYRFEEESGAAGIRQLLSQHRDQEDYVRFGTTAQGWPYTAVATPDLLRDPSWPSANLDRYVQDAAQRAAGYWYDERWDDMGMTVLQLRARLRDRGVSPLPAKKEDLINAYRTVVRGLPDHATMGEFHSGRWLVLLPAAPLLEAAMSLVFSAVSADALCALDNGDHWLWFRDTRDAQ